MKLKTLIITVATATITTSANAAIIYHDAPTGGATPAVLFEQHNGTGFVTFDASQTANNAVNSGDWELRTTGPGANANSTNTYSSSHIGNNAAQLRVTFTGLNASDSQEFFLYNISAGGAAAAQAKIDTNTTQTALYSGLNSLTSGGTNVLADGTAGNVPSGDQRVRYSLGSFTGSTSYAFIIDDFTTAPAGDRATFDGVGIETTVVPEPSSTALLGLGGLALLLRRRK